MQGTGTRQLGWWIALIALLLLGLGIRVNGIFRVKAGLSHDESVSYLCAAATQSLFERQLPLQVDTTLVAADIQRYYARPEHLQFRVVANDLAHDDIHPPLYFLVLHGLHYMVGFDLRTGPTLNLFLSLLLLCLLFRYGREFLGGPIPALAACVIWWLSPAVISIDLEARHYQLFGLIAMSMLAVGKRVWTGTNSLPQLLVFTVVNTLGLLTHYYYGFLLIPGVAIMLVRYGLKARSLWYAGSLLASVVLFIASFPEFLEFLPNYLSHGEQVAGGPVDHFQRVKSLVIPNLEFFSLWKAIAVMVVISAGILIVRVLVNEWGTVKAVWKGSSSFNEINTHLFWFLFFSVGLYVGGISPSQAVGGEYFSYIWPLLCLVIVHWARVVLSARLRGYVFAIFIAQLAFSCWFAVQRSPFVTNLVPESWYELMERSDMVVTNEGRRGYLPRMVTGLPPGMPFRICTGAGLAHFIPKRMHSVAYWLSVPKGTNAAPGLSERMRAEGFDEEVLQAGHYELRMFTRP